MPKRRPSSTSTTSPSKDHVCEHDVELPTGGEICRICDYTECRDCGMDYNKRDMGGLPMCYPCWCIQQKELDLKVMKREQERRKLLAAARKRKGQAA